MRRTLSVLAAVLVLTGCSGEDPVPPPPVTPSAVAPTPPPVRALAVEGSPLWMVRPGPTGPRSLSTVEIAGSAVVYSYDKADGSTWWTIADAATGKARWTARLNQSMSGLVVESAGRLAGPLLLGTYYRTTAAGSERGVFAVGVDDGKLRWTVPVAVRGKTDPGYHAVTIVDASDTAMVVGLEAVDDHAQVLRQQTLLYALGNPKPTWQVEGLPAYALRGTTVLAQRVAVPYGRFKEQPTDLVGLSAATGTEAWTMPWPEAPRLTLHAGPDVVVLSVKGSTSVLDAATGRLLDTGDYEATICRHSAKLILCRAVSDGAPEDYTLWRTKDGVRVVEPDLPDDRQVQGVVADYLVTSRYTGPGQYLLTDGSGKSIGEPMSGELTGLSKDFAVLENGSGTTREFAVHRVVV